MVAWERVMQFQSITDFWNAYRAEYSEGFRDIIDELIAEHSQRP